LVESESTAGAMTVLRVGEQDYTYGTGLLIFRMIFTPGGDR
jgi:hypothetical protein